MPTAAHTRCLTAVIIVLLALMGCATTESQTDSTKPQTVRIKYQSESEVPFLERAQTQTERDVRVTAAVPSAEESRKLFGVEMYKRGVQPVWFEIENKTPEPVWFLPAGVDPNYFTAFDVARLHRTTLSKDVNEELARQLYDRSMGMYVAPGAIRSGYVFTTLDEGTKAFIVDVASANKEVRTYLFYIPVPGLKLDHQKVDWDNLYKAGEVVSYDAEGLQQALAELPCCTTDKKGTGLGDPLNIVIIGDPDDVYEAFVRAGWDETETIYSTSLLKTARSFLVGGEYRYSPVSGLYVFGRPQDVAFQKARGSIHERNHLRLWLAPMRFEGKAVWIGQISRDIGVRFTTKTVTTHKIDPDVDETRQFLAEDLAYALALAKFSYVKGVGAAPIDEPRGNLTGDPYFTDGYRMVFWISRKPSSLTDIEFVDWEKPPGMIH